MKHQPQRVRAQHSESPPSRGVWIETFGETKKNRENSVAPLAGGVD